MTKSQQVLIGGAWRDSSGDDSFDAISPESGKALMRFPTSPWSEIEEALEASVAAYRDLAGRSPEAVAAFLDSYADLILGSSQELALVASGETALPAHPRFDEVEIPRTVNQLKAAAHAAKSRSWTDPILSTEQRIASRLAPIPGVVCVFGPNNFPFAFNGVSGGDFTAAVATGHPVLAKANPGHPETTRRLALLAEEAAHKAGLHEATIQLIYRSSHDDGARMVADSRVAATAYTGSRGAGLALKSAADAAGKPIYLEMSSVNPVIVFEGAIRERGDEIAEELVGSLLLGTGQFCTSPGLIFVMDSDESRGFLANVGSKLAAAPPGVLLGTGVASQLQATKQQWEAAGAQILESGVPGSSHASFPNTILHVSGERFLANASELQTEAFGNMSMVVVVRDIDDLVASIEALEGNLTGTVYSGRDGSDDGLYEVIEPPLRENVGRLLNDKAPTGVAVVPAMNHGGPYPATGHPGFTAVGIPTSLRRFGMLQCYDNVLDHRLPPELQAANPLGLLRTVDGDMTDRAIQWGGSPGS